MTFITYNEGLYYKWAENARNLMGYLWAMLHGVKKEMGERWGMQKGPEKNFGDVVSHVSLHRLHSPFLLSPLLLLDVSENLMQIVEEPESITYIVFIPRFNPT